MRKSQVEVTRKVAARLRVLVPPIIDRGLPSLRYNGVSDGRHNGYSTESRGGDSAFVAVVATRITHLALSNSVIFATFYFAFFFGIPSMLAIPLSPRLRRGRAREEEAGT